MMVIVTTRLGVIFRPDFHPHGLRDVAAAAEAAGVDELWLWEDCFQQGGIAQVAVALASTERLKVGIGLIPAPLRNVTAAAMEFATLDAMFPGRTRVAVGHGVQSWMRQAGAAVDSPLTLLREYVTALRALLRGEEVTADGRYVRLSKVRLDFPSASPYPILIGGTGPKTLRLADEAARQEVPTGGVFGVGGTAEQIGDGLAPYLAAGVDAVALQPLDSADRMAEFISTAGEVRALTS